MSFLPALAIYIRIMEEFMEFIIVYVMYVFANFSVTKHNYLRMEKFAQQN